MIHGHTILIKMFEDIVTWLNANLPNLIITIVTILIAVIIYRLVSRQIGQYVEKGRIDTNLSKNLRRIVKILIILIVISVILSLFTEALGLITSLFTLVGSTIFGFAAINTLGNAIAGLIIMISKPFKVGDRIKYGDQVADVLDIQFMHTKFRLLNRTVISIPNLTLMEQDIVNYSYETPVIRRSVVITVDYGADPDEIRGFLVEIVAGVDGVIQDPGPKSVVSNLGDYAVEYTTLYDVNDPKTMFSIDNDVRLAVLKACQNRGIDLTMPMLLHNV